MDVVAEGAETDSDAVELYQLGCEYAQGFVFGEPMTAEAARKILLADQLERQLELARLRVRPGTCRQAWPTSLDSMPGRMPIFCSA